MRFLVFLTALISAAIAANAGATQYAQLRLADGFDLPVGKPNAAGYYKARGFTPNGHLGEDWNGENGGNTDLGDPVYCIADGLVVQSKDVRVGWGNVIIVRHAYRDSKDGKVRVIDSLYGHLNQRFVSLNQRVKRGQRIGTIGTNRGMYLAHLHFEIRKNLNIGMHRTKFAKTYANYHSPSYFIGQNRKLTTNGRAYAVPVNTFAPYPGGNTAALKPTSNVVSAAAARQAPKSRIPVDSERRSSAGVLSLLSKARKSPSGLSTGAGTATRISNRSGALSPEVARIIERQSLSQEEADKQAQTSARRERFWSKFKKKFRSKEPEKESRQG